MNVLIPPDQQRSSNKQRSRACFVLFFAALLVLVIAVKTTLTESSSSRVVHLLVQDRCSPVLYPLLEHELSGQKTRMVARLSNSPSCFEECWVGLRRWISSSSKIDILDSHSKTPKPVTPHVAIRRSDVKNNIAIVGDVHGCADELEDLLKLLPKEDVTVFFVGDLVNKGPDSGRVLQIVQRLGGYCVRGNHDDSLLEAWYRTGRYADLPPDEPIARAADTVKTIKGEKDIEWLAQCPLSYHFPWLNVRIVHAGILPNLPVEQNHFEHLMYLRNVAPSATPFNWFRQSDEKKWIRHEHGGTAWAKNYEGQFGHIVFGHDAKRMLQQEKFATGLDTGACYGKRLTALIFSSDNFSARKLVHVDSKKEYQIPGGKYPGE